MWYCTRSDGCVYVFRTVVAHNIHVQKAMTACSVLFSTVLSSKLVIGFLKGEVVSDFQSKFVCVVAVSATG